MHIFIFKFDSSLIEQYSYKHSKTKQRFAVEINFKVMAISKSGLEPVNCPQDQFQRIG